MSELLSNLRHLEELCDKLLAEVSQLREVKRELTEENAGLREQAAAAEAETAERESERGVIKERVEKLVQGIDHLLEQAESPTSEAAAAD